MAADSPVRRRARRNRARPLNRRPKALSEEPTLFEAEPSASGGGAPLRLRPVRGGRAPQAAPPGGTGGFTDEEAQLIQATGDGGGSDPAARERARQIAARLTLARPRYDATSRRGTGDLASVPYRGASDDIDLDRTLEVLAERPVPDDEDIVVRERVRTRRSVVLAVDVSGSMRGERIRTAAATVGALAAGLARNDLAVVAFWSDAAVLLKLGGPVRPQELVDQLASMPARGLTNVEYPLQVTARELARAPARDARVVLLSDCVHNAGPDPRPTAARLPRLDVLLDVTGECDADLGRDLAAAGGGRMFRIRHHRDVAPALSTAFAS